MKSVIKKIFDKEIDEDVHSAFVKFSKGIFNDRYMVEAKKQKDKWNIKTSSEFANFLVRRCLEKTKGEIEVKGAIIATFKVADVAGFPIERVKQFMGIKQAIVNTKISPDKIISLMDKYPRAFYALSFKTGDFELKIKAKAPKSAKPAAAGDKGPSVDFCSIKTGDMSIAEDILFDCVNELQISITHSIQINDIELPKNPKTPEEMREKAIRKGKVIRTVKIGEKETRKEIGFEA